VNEALIELLRILDLEQLEEDIFRGQSPEDERQRIFGGQVAGQALIAAGRTVDSERHVHSLHAYFLLPGDPAVPMIYEVDRIRDGKSFTTRRVRAIQHGRPIFNLAASFHKPEQGFSHQASMPAVTPPEELPTFHERTVQWADRMGDWYTRPLALDIRYVDDPPWHTELGKRAPQQRVWMRADGELPDNQLLHACVIAYASDMTLLDSILLTNGESWANPKLFGASLDHAMWFHRPVRADEWLLYDQVSVSSQDARGFATGNIFSAQGTLAVSVAQEGLFRLVD
jgi:acyl-CoA thioesterase-2